MKAEAQEVISAAVAETAAETEVSGWRPIDSAPRNGTRILGRCSWVDPRSNYKLRYRVRKTWYGKTSHVPLYGWNYGRVENYELWQPTHWRPIPPQSSGSAP